MAASANSVLEWPSTGSGEVLRILAFGIELPGFMPEVILHAAEKHVVPRRKCSDIRRGAVVPLADPVRGVAVLPEASIQVTCSGPKFRAFATVLCR